MKNLLFIFLILPISAFADDLILSNITNGCSSDLNTDTIMLANFTRNQYQCNSGYYVPANYDGCMICPEYYDCNGGNFTFNENKIQGAKFKTLITSDIKNGCRTDFTKPLNNTANISPVFTPNIHTCTSGYYLPANVDGCTICPNDNYCPGGTYTFNETTDQGIAPCPSEHPFAPAGMWAATQCGRILHIGNEIIYLHQSPANPTEHRLYVRVNDTVYSVNLTQKQDDPDDIKMSAGANRSLHIMFNDIEYLAHDDSTENQ